MREKKLKIGVNEGVKRTRRTERSTEAESHIDKFKTTLKIYQIGKRQSMMDYIVSGAIIRLYSRQISTKNEQMPTKSTCTRRDDQRKDRIHPKRSRQRNCPKQLQTHNLPTDDVENINSTNKGRYLQLVKKPQIVPWGKERMLQRIQWHSRVNLHRAAHPKQEQNQTEISCYVLDWLSKGIWHGPQRWIINSLKMYKISHEFINFIEKTMKTRSVELTAGGRSLAEAKIRRNIFQGDALS